MENEQFYPWVFRYKTTKVKFKLSFVEISAVPII